MSEVQQEELTRLKMLVKLQSNADWKKTEKMISSQDGKSVAKNASIKKLFDSHLKKFGWLTYAYSGPQMTMKQLLANLSDDISRGDAVEQIKKIVRHYAQVKKEKKEIIESLEISKDLQYLSEVSSELMFIKDYRKGIYQKSYLAMDPVLEEIGKRLGLSLKEMKYLIIDEVIDALQNSRAAECKKIIAERMKKCCMITEKGMIRIYAGAECEKQLSKLGLDGNDDKKNAETVLIKGMIAYQGKARGKVKIILVESDVKKMEQGDILVSSATNPDLILAMKKASAIITDTGGIISHAAIVSRELKIPCIVSTRIATQVLHDGDLVEVDADKGEVRIISRNK
jgi:phosphohistidine swiveling domain-containing protein